MVQRIALNRDKESAVGFTMRFNSPEHLSSARITKIGT